MKKILAALLFSIVLTSCCTEAMIRVGYSDQRLVPLRHAQKVERFIKVFPEINRREATEQVDFCDSWKELVAFVKEFGEKRRSMLMFNGKRDCLYVYFYGEDALCYRSECNKY